MIDEGVVKAPGLEQTMPKNVDGHFLRVHFRGYLASDYIKQIDSKTPVVTLKFLAGEKFYIRLECWNELAIAVNSYVVPALEAGKKLLIEGWGNQRLKADEMMPGGKKVIISVWHAHVKDIESDKSICYLGARQRHFREEEYEKEALAV